MARPAPSGAADPGPARIADAPPIRLMLVDDSLVARSIFQQMLAPRGAFEVVAVANTADRALARLDEVAVDIILLDVEMPGMDGLTALPLLIEKGRGARVLVVSSACAAGGAAAVRALTLGAADTLPKPVAGTFGGDRFADLLADTLARIGPAPARAGPGLARLAPPAKPAPAITLRPSVAGPIGCIAIGASTGGLHALSAFFRALPAGVAVPILVTQHLPASFMPYFAAQIQEIAGRRAKVAADGDRPSPERMLIAPGDAHLGLAATPDGPRVRLDRLSAPSACLPSVDPMLASVAGIYGPAGIGVVLTGMGRDGVIAARMLGDAGGEVLVQDQASSVVWGMPGAIASAGHAMGVLPPAAIAARIALRHRAALRAGRRDAAPWR